MQVPIIAHPSKEFILQTDGSNLDLGTMISQYAEDKCEHPVAFASHKLLPHEVNYAVVEKEWLGYCLDIMPISHIATSMTRSSLLKWLICLFLGYKR